MWHKHRHDRRVADQTCVRWRRCELAPKWAPQPKPQQPIELPVEINRLAGLQSAPIGTPPRVTFVPQYQYVEADQRGVHFGADSQAEVLEESGEADVTAVTVVHDGFRLVLRDVGGPPWHARGHVDITLRHLRMAGVLGSLDMRVHGKLLRLKRLTAEEEIMDELLCGTQDCGHLGRRRLG